MSLHVESLTRQVFDLIWEKIMNHEYTPGDQIPTKQIAEENGISVMPVRLALQQLTNHGIVIKRERVGFYVASFSAQDLVEISQTRNMFELYCLSEYFDRIDLSYAQQIYETISSSSESNYEDISYRKLDTQLHSLFILASHNSFLIQQYDRVKDIFALCIYFDRNNTESHMKSRLEHLEILEHILKKDKTNALNALRRHLDRVVNNFSNIGSIK